MKLFSLFKHIFTEPKWFQKLNIPGVICVIPFIGLPYLTGWFCSMIHNARWNSPRVLPDPLRWTYLKDGLKLFISFVIYALPLGLLRLLEIAAVTLCRHLLPSRVFTVTESMFGHIYSFCSLIFLLGILMTVPVVLIIYCENLNFRDTLNLRRIYRGTRDNLKEVLPLSVAFCFVILSAAFGASLLIVGICVTTPLACAIYAKILGENPVGDGI